MTAIDFHHKMAYKTIFNHFQHSTNLQQLTLKTFRQKDKLLIIGSGKGLKHRQNYNIDAKVSKTSLNENMGKKRNCSSLQVGKGLSQLGNPFLTNYPIKTVYTSKL